MSSSRAFTAYLHHENLTMEINVLSRATQSLTASIGASRADVSRVVDWFVDDVAGRTVIADQDSDPTAEKTPGGKAATDLE